MQINLYGVNSKLYFDETCESITVYTHHSIIYYNNMCIVVMWNIKVIQYRDTQQSAICGSNWSGTHIVIFKAEYYVQRC